MSISKIFKKIPPNDIAVNPFKAYKHWYLTGSNFLSGSDPLATSMVAMKPNPAIYNGNVITLGSIQTIHNLVNTTNANSYIPNTTDVGVLYYSLDNMYYGPDTFGYNGPQNKRMLYDTASVFSIPQQIYGEAIKPGSINIRWSELIFYATDPNQSFLNFYLSSSLVDDTYGNIIDTYLSASLSDNVLYLGFNDMRYNTDLIGTVSSKYAETISYVSASFDTSYLYGYIGYPVGLGATFSNSGYIRIPNSDTINFGRCQDFAISMYVYANSMYSASTLQYNYLLSKRTDAKGVIFQNNQYYVSDVNLNEQKYPYDIKFLTKTGSLSNSLRTIYASRSDGVNTVTISGSMYAGAQVNKYRYNYPENSTHILYQKTGSLLQLYINGALSQQSTDTTTEMCSNECDVFLGNLGKSRNGFNGTIDEVNFFNRALTSSEIAILTDTGLGMNALNTNIVGNVVYSHGIMVISDPRYQYNLLSEKMNTWDNVGLNGPASTDLRINFQGIHTIYEHEILCRIKDDEFNTTMNPTSQYPNDILNNVLTPCSHSQELNVAENENFNPYITTVGLYDDYGRLLAIGKLANPIPKLSTVDMNIFVKFDL